MTLAETLDNPLDGLTLSGRFRIEGEHDLDGLGTLRGVDIETGAEVAIATVSATDAAPDVCARLDHELALLRNSASPYLSAVIAVGLEHGLLLRYAPPCPARR